MASDNISGMDMQSTHTESTQNLNIIQSEYQDWQAVRPQVQDEHIKQLQVNVWN